jgi:GDP-L-fucose synthase
MGTDAKIYVAGHQGLVGGAIWRRLQTTGFKNLVGCNLEELDLRDQAAVTDFFSRERPEYVFLAAARVGGIRANATFPADFIYDNLMIQTNLIHQAYRHEVKKAPLPGEFLHLPQALPPAHERRLSSGRQTGTH